MKANNSRRIRVARVVTSSMSFVSLMPVLERLAKDDEIEIYLISGDSFFDGIINEKFPNFNQIKINMRRDIDLIRDFLAVIKLAFVLIKKDIDIVHSHTPKAGLVSALASFLACRKFRIHTFTGQVWVDYSGFKRIFFKWIDKIIYTINTICYVDSLSQKQYLLSSGIGSENKLRVLGRGSLSGIDVQKFAPCKIEEKILLQKDLFGDDFDGTVLLFVGRVHLDKGVFELLNAFSFLKKEYQLKLLMVGTFEVVNNEKFIKLFNDLICSEDLKFIDFTNDVKKYYESSDIFCLPTYREGCPVSILEASSMMLPVVSTNIYGVWDVLRNEETGLFCRPKDWVDLKDKIEILLKNKELRNIFGKNGRIFVKNYFEVDKIANELIYDYKELIV